MPAPPSEIGEYRLIRLLGRGAMGEVYLAEDRTLDRKVAIKLISAVRAHPDARARFALEARAIAKLKHPNVVTVYRTGELDGRPYLVSELVEGTPLDRLDRPVPRDLALAIARGLARGLAAAHRVGVLHRDVKPANAILDGDGVVKLLDFGLAKLDASAPDPTPAPPSAGTDVPSATEPTLPVVPADDTPHNQRSTITFSRAPGPPAAPGAPIDLTLAGTKLGTPRYMSPEAWRGGRLTAASDVYSLGVVMWELFADRHPFAARDGEVEPARVCDDEPPSILEAVPDLPRALARVIDRAVRRKPEARYPDAGALAAELDAELATAPRRSSMLLAGAGALAASAAAVAILWGREAPTSPPPRPSPSPPPTAPRALTALGGCADTPAFLDPVTIAFTQTQGDTVDVMITTGSGAPTSVVTSTAWDWRPVAGRHRGELLFIREDARSYLFAVDRASALERRLASATSAVAIGETIYVTSDETPGQLARVGDAGLEPIATLPSGKVPDAIASSATGERIALVVADPESPPGLCVVELGDRSVRCPPTERLINGRPAMTHDGRFVYYAARSGIRRIDLHDGGDALVVPGARANGGLALSPDDRRLVFSDCRTYGSIIAIGGAASEVLVEQGLVKHPSGGADGALAWIAARDGGGTRLMVRMPGQPARELATAATEIGRPAFDPTGTNLAYSDAGEGGGVRSIAVAGGDPTVWTDDPNDRAPVWTPDGGLAFTRLGDGGHPTVVQLAAPGDPVKVVVDGWTVEDVDVERRALLVLEGAQRLGRLDLATGKIAAVALGAVGDHEVIGARILRDGGALLVLAGASGGTFYRVDAAGTATVVHEVPAGQTAGPPTVLSDGRFAFRPEIWLGELYEVEGSWADPVDPRR